MFLDFFVAVYDGRYLSTLTFSIRKNISLSHLMEPVIVRPPYLPDVGQLNYGLSGLHESAALRSQYFRLGSEYTTKLPFQRPQNDYLDKMHLLPDFHLNNETKPLQLGENYEMKDKDFTNLFERYRRSLDKYQN